MQFLVCAPSAYCTNKGKSKCIKSPKYHSFFLLQETPAPAVQQHPQLDEQREHPADWRLHGEAGQEGVPRLLRHHLRAHRHEHD